jgi:selenobiotic family peptide radical SAM maturase
VTSQTSRPEDIYPVTLALIAFPPGLADPLSLPEFLGHHDEWRDDRPWLAELAAIERACHHLRVDHPELPGTVQQRIINPSLEMIPVQWQGLVELLTGQDAEPVRGEGVVLVYLRPDGSEVRFHEASGHDLLALKLISEGIDSRQAARESGVSVGRIDDIIHAAVYQGYILAPPSKLVREDDFPRGIISDPEHFTTPTFTLQWHLTQECDLHCRHCYDRADCPPMELDMGIRVLDDLYDFCREHHVFTQVTFTGGNPMLHPHFLRLYREAVDRGFMTAILGNPMPRHRIEEMVAVHKPEFYQVSLEGLRDHNDYIRGRGHFDRVLSFLDLLAELDIYSMVMLTLTRANLDQVLDLAELLRDRVRRFTFNRLAMVGEGAALASVRAEDFPAFLKQYRQAAQTNPCMGEKDNLFNLLRRHEGQPLMGGCAGYGCGAAFNFVSMLPDGQVHACRKLPSPIGDITRQRFAEIYYGRQAQKYRAGSRACRDCGIRPVCGGCLAVAHGFGLDIFSEKDPYCFC